MSFPWADWQFWAVTGLAAWGGWALVRQFLPRRGGNACGACASGAAASAKKRPESEGPLVVLGGRRRAGKSAPLVAVDSSIDQAGRAR